MQFRTRSLAGRWSGWVDAAPGGRGSAGRGHARARPRRHLAARQPVVGRRVRTGSSTGCRGTVSRLRAHFVWSPAAGVPARTLQKAGAPAIVPRSGWNADEKIRRGEPGVRDQLSGSRSSTTPPGRTATRAAQSPAIVRGDPALPRARATAGTTSATTSSSTASAPSSKGRYGGIERNVVGAHAEGFNTGSVGVAVLGEYSSLAVAAKARERARAAARVAARRRARRPGDHAARSSRAATRASPAGVPVFLRTVSGHRDTGFTDCPGTALYSLLTGSPARSRGLGLPKLYAPLVTGTVPGPGPLPGAALGAAAVDGRRLRLGRERRRPRARGSAPNVDWTWDATAAAAGQLLVRDPLGCERDAGVRPDRRRRRRARRRRPRRRPETVTPNADGDRRR